MESQQEKFLRLVKELEALKEQTVNISSELEAVMKDLGVGYTLQDPTDQLVYKVSKPKGKFVYYADVEYLRTAKPGEDRGSLSQKEAKAAGFVLRK